MSKIVIAIGTAIVIATLGAAVFVQQQTIKDLRQDNEALKQQAAQAAQSQEQVSNASQEAAADSASPSETQAREVARLRNEVAQLRGQSNALAKAQETIRTLTDRVQTEAEATKTAVATAVATTQADLQKKQLAEDNMNACINNLRLIDAAKQQWALENKKLATDTPEVSDLQPYVGRGTNGEMPSCPDGGTYTFGTIGERPVCTIPTHVLP
jgi:membrane protein involved in colicin uptake